MREGYKVDEVTRLMLESTLGSGRGNIDVRIRQISGICPPFILARLCKTGPLALLSSSYAFCMLSCTSKAATGRAGVFILVALNAQVMPI